MSGRSRPTRRGHLGGAALVLALAVGCASPAPTSPVSPAGSPTPPPASASSPNPTRGATVSPPTPPRSTPPRATPARSAVSDLARFLDQAERMDAQLRATAQAINAGIGQDAIRISATARNAVKAIDLTRAARRIPAGMDDDLLRAVLLVYNDLATRYAAFGRILEYSYSGPLARTGAEAKDLIRCLGNGADPADRFATDLAAVRAIASRTPALASVRADSRAAAEVAVRVEMIDTSNTGCGECGAPVTRPVELPPITWRAFTDSSGLRWDGTIGSGVFRNGLFRVEYSPASGWAAHLNVC